MINGAPTFITLLESPSRRAHEVRLVLPRAWAKSFSGMTPGLADNTYVAPDYDTLVDSPIVAGSPSVYEFSVRGKPHYLVNFRERGVWNGPQAARDLAETAETIARILGRRAVRSVLLPQRHRIGSERARAQELDAHEYSARRDAIAGGISRSGSALRATSIFMPGTSSGSVPSSSGRSTTRTRSTRNRSGSWKGSPTTTPISSSCARVSRHARSTSTRSRSRFARCRRPRAGWSSRSNRRPTTRGSSTYRADENTPNTAISYYVKGAVIGFLLDAHIRRMTGGAKSLDDVMRLMRSRFSGEKGFSREDVRAAVAEVAGPAHAREIRAWMARALETTAELDYTEAMEWFGLRMTPPAGGPACLAWRDDPDRKRKDHHRGHSPRFAGRSRRHVAARRNRGHQRRAAGGRAADTAARAAWRRHRK